MKKLFLILIALGSVASIFSGCETVEPWEKGDLAQYSMLSDRDSLENTMSEHVYYTREAANGGNGVGGGGCGCN